MALWESRPRAADVGRNVCLLPCGCCIDRYAAAVCMEDSLALAAKAATTRPAMYEEDSHAQRIRYLHNRIRHGRIIKASSGANRAAAVFVGARFAQGRHAGKSEGATGLALLQIVHEPRTSRLVQQARPILHPYSVLPDGPFPRKLDQIWESKNNGRGIPIPAWDDGHGNERDT